MKNNKLRCTAPRSEDAELRAMQAEIERTNTRLHEVATLCATVEQERDAALARLAELEKQEPVIYQAKTKPGFLSTSAYAWEDCEKADFLVYEADGVHVRGLYAAAGASLVATPIVAWAKSTPRKLRITTMDMGREDGWRPLGYTAAGASPVEPSQAQPPAPGDAAITYMTGYSDGREWAQADILYTVEPMTAVADRYAHRLALELECVLADRPGYYDKAIKVLSEYRSAMNAIHEHHSPTFMGEPLIAQEPKP